ncbi:MAG: CCA tRNA nucleotidyltransferase [Dehalococcoidales bacterium]|nr:CCA tRNA nucleotidyltransferase [Dehalococcoidales bacterium]
MNLADKIKEGLPAELVNFLVTAGGVAETCGDGLYLVGGVVRDLLLGRQNLDLDLVVEGDTKSFAGGLAGLLSAKLVAHPRFGTARLRWDDWSADIATARSETYARPGALPAVKPGNIQTDLFRRDFTINAMAIELSAPRYGELIDRFGGLADLERKSIRILHERSFIDDATRIWRAIRYEQRLDFKIEPRTLELLKQGILMLDTVSGDRVRHELELVLKEPLPEKALRRAAELGVLAKIHPSLKGDNWLTERFVRARQLTAPEPPALALYVALLTCRLTADEAERLLGYLRFPNTVTRILEDVANIKVELDILTDRSLTPSGIYTLLDGYHPTALQAIMLAMEVPLARERIEEYLDKLRHIRTALTGADLARMGITGGHIKEVLNSLRNARLDGKIKSREDEVRWVEEKRE